MSGQEIRLDPARAHRGGRDLADAGQRIAAVRAGLGAALDAAGQARPWGGDDLGAAFHRTYAPGAQAVLDAWQTIAAYVEALGAATVTSVADLTAADTQGGERVRGAHR